MRKNMVPLISVIICTFNTKDITIKCLERLKAAVDASGEIVETILVENGTDGTARLVKNKFGWVRVIEPETNTGFAKGNNLGIAASHKASRYVLLLNSDAFVNQDTLERSVDFMKKYPDCDVLGCKLRLENGSVQPSGGYLPTPYSVLTWLWGLDLIPVLNKLFKTVHPKNTDFFDKTKKIGWVMGAYVFMKREVIIKTGGMDEKLFMYMEEVEWFKRISENGFGVYYTPDFEITHLDKSSSKGDSEKLSNVFVSEVVGIKYYINKHFPNASSWVFPLMKLGMLVRVIIFSILGNNIRKRAYQKALQEI